MIFLGFSAIVAAICNFGLTLFVLATQKMRSPISRVYVLWGGAVTIWNIATYFLVNTRDPHTAMIWAMLLQAGVICLPLANLQFCLLLAEISIGRWLLGVYAFHALLLVSLASGQFITGVRDLGYSYYSVAGPWFWAFAAFYAVSTCGTMLALYRKQKLLAGLRRARIRWLIGATGILIVFGTHDLLPVIGIYRYPVLNTPVYPLGNLAAVFYGLIVGYSTLQHQLLDVHVVLGRMAAQIVRLGFVFLIGLVSLMIVSFVARATFNQTALFSSLIVLVVTIFTASLLFPRLFGGSGEGLERRILGDRFEYHDRVRTFTSSLPTYSDVNVLLGDLDELLEGTIGVGSYKIILLDETSRVFSLFRSHPEEDTRQLPELHAKSPVFQFFETNKVQYLACGADSASPMADKLEKGARQQLAQFDAEFCLPFFFEKQPFGLLLLGRKANDEPYTATDISLLASLTKNLSLVINQIRLRDHVLRAQEMDLLGRMSRGLAHDLNNLLTPVWTLAELASTGASMEDITEDILPVAMRNLKTMRAYIREALFFSENLRPDFQLGRLDVLVKQAVDVLEGKRAQKQIRINVTAPSDALIEMDEVLIQRLIGNILSNAIDASPQGSSIRVDVTRLIQTDAMRDWFRVRVIDEGEGIAPEHLSRISTPYFTTKNRGDETRGFGLGLAICRKIIHLHAANMNVFSQVKKGTTVQVDMPSRQLKPAEPATPSFKQ